MSEAIVVKVVVAKVVPKGLKRRRGSVAKRRVRGPDGEFMKQFWVDANSITFDDDLTHVFKLNVARARRANKEIFASPDGSRKAAGKVADKLKSSGSLDDFPKK